MDPKDLLEFDDRDIKKLATFQIQVDPLYEHAGKTFTGMVASMIRNKLLARALREAEAHLVDKP